MKQGSEIETGLESRKIGCCGGGRRGVLICGGKFGVGGESVKWDGGRG